MGDDDRDDSDEDEIDNDDSDESNNDGDDDNYDDRCIMAEILPTSGSYSLMNRLVRNLTAIAKPKNKTKTS